MINPICTKTLSYPTRWETIKARYEAYGDIKYLQKIYYTSEDAPNWVKRKFEVGQVYSEVDPFILFDWLCNRMPSIEEMERLNFFRMEYNTIPKRFRKSCFTLLGWLCFLEQLDFYEENDLMLWKVGTPVGLKWTGFPKSWIHEIIKGKEHYYVIKPSDWEELCGYLKVNFIK